MTGSDTTRQAAGSRPAAALAGVMLLAVTFAAYAPVWDAGFVFDDRAMILDNPLIRSGSGLHDFWLTVKAPDYFPLTSTMFWVEYRLFGNQPRGYHLVNVMLHALSALLAWRVMLRLQVPGAWMIAAVFAVHPVTAASAAWISERKNTLSLMLALASLLMYLRYEDLRGLHRYIFALLLFVLALLAKTSMVMLPVVMFLLLPLWRRRRVGMVDVVRIAPFLLASLVLGLVTMRFQQRNVMPDMLYGSIESHIAAAAWCLWFYFCKIIWPVNLMMIYPRWSVQATNLLHWVPALLMIALAAALVVTRRTTLALGVAIGAFALMLAPVLGLVPMAFHQHSLVSDHLQYPAMLGPIALVVGVVVYGLRRWRVGLLPQIVLAVLVLAVLATLTWQRAGVFRDEWSLWTDNLAKNPQAWAAHLNIGSAHLDRGEIGPAMTSFERTLSINPQAVVAMNNLGYALMQQGRVMDAKQQLEHALKLRPGYASAHSNFGSVLSMLGRHDEALSHYRTALASNPYDAQTHINLGNTLISLRRFDEARDALHEALQLQRDSATAHNALGSLYQAQGLRDQAMNALHQALAIDANHVQAHNNLGNLYAAAQQYDMAIEHYTQAVNIRPEFELAHYNLALACEHVGRVEQAVEHYLRAAQLRPNWAMPFERLAWLWATHPRVMRPAPALEYAQYAAKLARQQNAGTLDILAAAYAANGQFTEAAATAQNAVQLAQTHNDPRLADMESRLRLYLAGDAYLQLDATKQ